MIVKLDEIERSSALYAGACLWAMSVHEKLRDNVKKPGGKSSEIVQMGQLGERVVAKALDLYWSSAANTFHKPDLSHNIEVRSTGRKDAGVKVLPSDSDDKRMVGVYIPDLGAGEFEITGWCYAWEGKQKGWYGNPGNRPNGWAWFVGRQHMRPLSELKAIIARERLDAQSQPD